MAPVDSMSVATMLLPEPHSPLRSLEMDSSIIDPVVANTKAPPSEMAVLSSSETEASPVAAAERIHNETSSSVDRGDNVSHQPMISMPQNDDYCQDKSPEIATQDHHRQTQSLARGGTFVTPKRLKINNVVLPNKHLAHDKTKESYHNFPMGPPGNAVTPASIRGGSTPGTLATSPDSISDGMACGKENEDARGAVSTPAVGNKGTDAHTGLTETETIFDSIRSDAGSDVKMEPSTQSTPMQMKMDPSMSLASSSVKAINLGPRMNPPRQSTPAKAIPLMPRKQSPQRAPQHQTTSPVVPRRLDSVMANKGLEQSGGTIDAPSALSEVASAATSLAVRSDSRDESSPSMEDIPPPSHFLAAKISPLRSSSRLKKSESKIRERDLTPPPSSTSSKYETSKSPRRELPDIANAKLLSPCGMFLSPRTPKPINMGERDCPKSSASACLTPSNFASDFGRGHKKESSFDASDVFSWLKSPTGQGLFSPNGGLALSVTNTPRGMYGFFGGGGGATTTACATSGKTPYTPSANLAPSANLDSSCFFTDVEGLPTGGEEVASPKATDNQRSMICISPLASQKTGGAKKACAAPETPMSINFSEVFASPRYTPRFRGSAKKDGNPSPVISALHVAERDVLDDEDLSDLLQLAGTTTPGGRPLGLLSPLLTSSFRKMASKSQRDGDDTPPDSLQLPMISGKSTADGPMTMLARKGSPRGNYTNPPQLSIRSTSSGVLDDGAKSSQKKSKPKKRKASDIGQPTQGMGPSIPAGGHHHHHQGMGYPHPNMLHYRHHPGQMQAPLARHNSGVYYHQPHQHHAHPHSMPPGNHHPHSHMAYPPPHPAPQHHYAYSEQQSTATASSASSKPPRMTKRQAAKEAKSKGVAKSGTEAPAPPKKKAKKPPAKKPKSNASTALEDPEERERVAAAIRAVNESSGGGNEKAAALAAAILRGVTMRPSGKWQAQLYYAGKSRYIGVFDSREKAALAYEIAREVLKTEKGSEPTSAEETDRNVTLARKAAFAGVNESNLTS